MAWPLPSQSCMTPSAASNWPSPGSNTIATTRSRCASRGVRLKGASQAIADLAGLLKSDAISESSVNSLGYGLLSRKQTADAIRIFQLNVELYPDSANTYDSLGEAYMAAGDKAQAVKNYEKSLSLNPQNTNATAMLKRLREM